MSLDSDPNKVIPGSVAGALNALKSAYGEPSVKRFVFTSSSAAAAKVDEGGLTITEDSWNEQAVEAAWAEPPYGPDRAGPVYAASKTQSEQEVWKFHKENREKRPDFVVNTGEYGSIRGYLHQLTIGSPSQLCLWKGSGPCQSRLSKQRYLARGSIQGRDRANASASQTAYAQFSLPSELFHTN